jgi:hypothetical protein
MFRQKPFSPVESSGLNAMKKYSTLEHIGKSCTTQLVIVRLQRRITFGLQAGSTTEK